ncbi:MAG: metallopeptidase TldD-related protein [candidate division KSB1 bacterium]|nr:metallopeptidase TldD-related protein [candidate division KSB1 bacterium]
MVCSYGAPEEEGTAGLGRPSPACAVTSYDFGLSPGAMHRVLTAALDKGGDFAELFLEYRVSTSVVMEEDLLKETSESVTLGAGVRVLAGEETGYAYTNDLSSRALRHAGLTAAAIALGEGRTRVVALRAHTAPHQVYDLDQLLSVLPLPTRLDIVQRAYQAAQAYDHRVSRVQVSMSDVLAHVLVANSEGLVVTDLRPQVRLAVNVVAECDGVRNRGTFTAGGRVGLGYFQRVQTPEQVGRTAAEEAITLLQAVDPPAGEQPVVLGAGQSGVMIHEAVGHPLEADGNRKGTSIMANRMGSMVATPQVTVYDDPTIPHLRGSLNIDDEGTPTQRTVLIERGRLVGYLQDRLSARLMGMAPTGNGRRESYQHYPIPRMTNTVLAEGAYSPEEVIASVKKGFYAKTFKGGQVEDSGKFVFSVNLGYLIEDGRLTRPVKNATLIGTNVQVLQSISMVANDMGFFLGTCGKEGQSVPVTAGTPTLRIDQMTVGGRR